MSSVVQVKVSLQHLIQFMQAQYDIDSLPTMQKKRLERALVFVSRDSVESAISAINAIIEFEAEQHPSLSPEQKAKLEQALAFIGGGPLTSVVVNPSPTGNVGMASSVPASSSSKSSASSITTMDESSTNDTQNSNEEEQQFAPGDEDEDETEQNTPQASTLDSSGSNPRDDAMESVTASDTPPADHPREGPTQEAPLDSPGSIRGNNAQGTASTPTTGSQLDSGTPATVQAALPQSTIVDGASPLDVETNNTLLSTYQLEIATNNTNDHHPALLVNGEMPPTAPVQEAPTNTGLDNNVPTDGSSTNNSLEGGQLSVSNEAANVDGTNNEILTDESPNNNILTDGSSNSQLPASNQASNVEGTTNEILTHDESALADDESANNSIINNNNDPAPQTGVPNPTNEHTRRARSLGDYTTEEWNSRALGYCIGSPITKNDEGYEHYTPNYKKRQNYLVHYPLEERVYVKNYRGEQVNADYLCDTNIRIDRTFGSSVVEKPRKRARKGDKN